MKLALAQFILVAIIVSTAESVPPSEWQEHWFEHNQLGKNVYRDNDVAINFDDDVKRSITWPNKFVGDVWRYVKRNYGNFGPENNIYAIFHAKKYSGGHPSTYFDGHHDYRNVIDVGAATPDAWVSGQGNDHDIVTHEIAHIVETASNGIHGSPAFRIWGDSKWAEIFIYDVYLRLGRTADAQRFYNMMQNSCDNFPSPNSCWFKNFFYPIYNTKGQTKVLVKFFKLLSQHFPKNGQRYARDLNFGEFIHFMSGAAGINVRALAEFAFGWKTQWQTEFNNAWQHSSLGFVIENAMITGILRNLLE